MQALIVNDSDNYSLKTDYYNFTIENNRPNNFSWTNPKVQGGNFNLTATEWNNFAERVNEFREYQNLQRFNFTPAIPNNQFTANMYNQVRVAIQEINGYGAFIPTVSSGGQISAYMLNIIVSELNAIP